MSDGMDSTRIYELIELTKIQFFYFVVRLCCYSMVRETFVGMVKENREGVIGLKMYCCSVCTLSYSGLYSEVLWHFTLNLI